MILPTNWNDIFACWKYYYQGSILQNPKLIRAWVALPKYICWNILVSINKELFEGEASRARKVILATKSMWVEALGTRGMTHIHTESLNFDERAWKIDLLQTVTNN